MKTKKRIPIPSRSGLDLVPLDDILYAEADGNYTKLTLKSNRFTVVCKSLKWISSQLEASEYFCRIHHSSIVNTNYIQRYLKGDGGQVEMKDGKILNVSRARKSDFLKALYDKM